jgi:hypothetical protein
MALNAAPPSHSRLMMRLLEGPISLSADRSNI